jgi:hypothetical protein
MFDERLETIMKIPENKFLFNLRHNSIFVIAPNTEKYEKAERKLGKREISADLMRDILSHEDSYEYVLKLFRGELEVFTVYFVTEEGKYLKQYTFTKKQFINTLEEIIFELTPEQFEQFNVLISLMGYDKFVERYKNTIVDKKIDGTEYHLYVGDYIEFLELPEDQYLTYMSDENCFYKGIPITHFLYGIYRFFNCDTRVKDEYLFPENIQKRLDDITYYRYIDIEAVNRITQNEDFNFNQIKVNEELRKLILKDMPPYLTLLEKAIYIYIKMCKVLTYDEEFYAVHQRGPVALRHEEVENVAKITPTNNRVVCYEFTAIYEKLVAELGISFSTYQALLNGFGGGHSNIELRIGKYIVEADAVTSILNGDLMRAKVNQGLVGISCHNKCQQTREEFYHAYEMVYRLIANQEKQITGNEVGKQETFDDILPEYLGTTDKVRHVDAREKVDILVAKVNATKLQGMDAMAYILHLRRILFTEQEQKDYFAITIIRENTPNRETVARPQAIFSIRIPEGPDFIVKYYVYYPGEPFKELTAEELQILFNASTYEYIDKEDPEIPGIKGGEKHVK